jgi:hypothetical protein
MKECGGKKETEMPDGALSIFGADPGGLRAQQVAP